MQSRKRLLVEKLARLGVEDPEGAARSEITEDIPQVALARLERLVRTNLMRRRESMDIWWANLQRERDRRPESRPAVVAEVIAKCLDAGITLDELGVIVEDVASGTAHGFAYLLGDPYDDELGDPSDLPSWVLCEVSPDDEGGQLTGRTMGGLHEFLGPKE
ncbi:hypothetical protein [Actinopolymorpha sp. B9G3]|uniref:hypothetical protein n=1 Tax=Actinopolymorpha sp. B9G3 TaxID=3158970 RepID=UPI0032D8C970